VLSESLEDQYRRMHRQYDLLRRTADQNQFKEIHEMNRSRDILYHFCCDAFPLKDWIINADNQTQAIVDSVSALLPNGGRNPPSLGE
jgi:hypothetical protein